MYFRLNSSNTTYLTIDDTGHRHHRSIIIPTDTSIRTGEEGGCDVDFGVDFGFFFGESTSAEENGDEKEISSDGEASPHTNATDPPGEINNTPKMLFSIDNVLRDGLFFAGFSDERITRCGEKRNIDCFKAHYGVGRRQ